MRKLMLFLTVVLSVSALGQTTRQLGVEVEYAKGFGYTNPAYIGYLGIQHLSPKLYEHGECTLDTANKIRINSGTQYRCMYSFAYRVNKVFYAGMRQSGSFLKTREYTKWRQNFGPAVGWIGPSGHFDFHVAYYLPYANNERTQGLNAKLVWHVKKHLDLEHDWFLGHGSKRQKLELGFAGWVQEGAYFTW